MADSYHVSVYEPLPLSGRLADFDLNPDIVALRWSRGIPGGFLACDVGVDRPSRRELYEGGWRGYLPLTIDLAPFAHVEIHCGQETVFEGRIQDLHRNPLDGSYGGFTAYGYGVVATQDDYYTTVSVTTATSGTILEQVLAEVAPLLRVQPGQIEDPQISHTYDEFDKLAPAQVIDQLSREGGITDHVWDWMVTKGRRARWVSRRPVDTPDYRCNWGPHVTDWTERYGMVYGTAAVNYEVAGVEATTASATTTGFVGRYGINRSYLIVGDEMTATGAEQFRDTWLALHEEPEIQAALSVYELRTPQGIAIPAALIGEGQSVRVGDAPPLPIIGIEFDGLSRLAQVELGAPVLSLPKNLFRQADDARQHAIRKTDLVTGTRKR